MVFGIEYNTDYYTGVLLISVPLEVAYNMLSQIEKTDGDDLTGEMDSQTIPPGEPF
jgi:hypothetical protein